MGTPGAGPSARAALAAAAAAAALAALLAAAGAGAGAGAQAYAQAQDGADIRLATYQETAQVVIAPAVSDTITAAITLQSTSGQEIRIPPDLEDMLLADDRVVAVVVTNEDRCVLGVREHESCVMVNVKRDPEWGGIRGTQDTAREIGMLYIGAINSLLDIDASFHSVFIHHRDEANVALDTSGVVSGRDTVSAVFTMPMESTDTMFEKSSAILLARPIRDAGGFYDAAAVMAAGESAKMTFSILPSQSGALYQLKVSAYRDGAGSAGPSIRPLDYLGVDVLRRSDYFSGAFYPLNSLVHVLVVGNGTIVGSEPGPVETRAEGGVDVPADLEQAGWIISGGAGEDGGRSDARFLFGRTTSVGADGFSLAVGGPGAAPAAAEAAAAAGGGPGGDGAEGEGGIGASGDEWHAQAAAAAVAVAAAGGAAAFFLRGYKRAPGSKD